MQRVAFERVFKPRLEMGAPDEAVVGAQLQEVDRFLQILDERLTGRSWVANGLSVADFALASTFMLRNPARMSLARVPAVSAWIERLEKRESWQRAVAPFSEFLAG